MQHGKIIIQETQTETCRKLHYFTPTDMIHMRCYFNMRSKADTSQLNLPHRNQQLKSEKQKN